MIRRGTWATWAGMAAAVGVALGLPAVVRCEDFPKSESTFATHPQPEPAFFDMVRTDLTEESFDGPGVRYYEPKPSRTGLLPGFGECFIQTQKLKAGKRVLPQPADADADMGEQFDIKRIDVNDPDCSLFGEWHARLRKACAAEILRCPKYDPIFGVQNGELIGSIIIFDTVGRHFDEILLPVPRGQIVSPLDSTELAKAVSNCDVTQEVLEIRKEAILFGGSGLPARSGYAIGSAIMSCFEKKIGKDLIPDFGPYYRQLQEDHTGTLLFGFGVNSDAGLQGSIVLNERNFDVSRGQAEETKDSDTFREPSPEDARVYLHVSAGVYRVH
jgi:hypothetical protein